MARVLYRSSKHKSVVQLHSLSGLLEARSENHAGNQVVTDNMLPFLVYQVAQLSMGWLLVSSYAQVLKC